MGKRAYVKRMYNAAGEPSDLVIPSNDGIWKIGPYACYNSKTLRSVIVPHGVTEIGFKAFFKCTALEHIELPLRLASIADCAFKNCDSLESIVIPEGVTSIGDWAFMGSGLKQIVIPDSVTHIGKHAFLDCKLGEMNWGNARYAIKNGLFIDKSDGSAYCADSSLENIIIPDGVKHLVSFKEGYDHEKLLLGAFHKSKVKSVYIPESVELTDTNTFNECKSLEKVEFKNPAIKFGRNTFKECISLTDVVLPAGLTWARVKSKFLDSPCGYASEDTQKVDKSNKLGQLNEQLLNQLLSPWDHSINMKSGKSNKAGSTYIVIHFPNGNALYDILNLKKSIDFNEYLSKCQAIANATDGIKTVYFNKSSKAITVKNYPFLSHIERVVIQASIKTVKEFAFISCHSLQSVILPETVKAIGRCAFSDCISLKTVNIPKGVETIPPGCFSGCISLQGINKKAFLGGKSESGVIINNPDIKIDNYAFVGCTNVHFENEFVVVENGYLYSKDFKVLLSGKVINGKTVIKEGVEEIADEAYADEFDLECVEIPPTVTKLGTYVFGACAYLKHISIPNSLTEIPEGTFFMCEGLKSVTIPESITKIGDKAFCICRSLTNISLPSSLEEIGKYAFDSCANLKTITIPCSVKKIGIMAFARNIYSNNYILKVLAPTPPEFVKEDEHNKLQKRIVFGDNNLISKILVPAESLKLYKKAPGWKMFKDIILPIYE